MKIAFCTCVQIGLSCIESIYEIGGHFDLLISLHDHKAINKSGRIYLDEIAQKHDVPLLKINHINDSEVVQSLKDHKIDWLFIIGWSQIASVEIINVPLCGVIGAHPTLLPQGRGRAAVPWAILKGLDKTGVTFFKMDEGVDTGEILAQYEIPISPNETATQLYLKVNNAHISLIQSVWAAINQGTLVGCPQNESDATYWDGRNPEDGYITPEMTLEEVDRLVRATTHPYPGAFVIKDGKKCIIWSGTKDSTSEGFPVKCYNGIYMGTEVEWVSS
jgi:methionyl-tRNA formyltransferase